MQNHSISVKNSIKAKNRKNIAVKKYSIQNSKRNSIKIVKQDIYYLKMNNLNNKKRCWKKLSPVIV